MARAVENISQNGQPTIELLDLFPRQGQLFGKWVSRETARSKLLDGFEVSVDEVMA